MPRHPRLNRSAPAVARSLRLEPLEDRRVLSVTLEMLTDGSQLDYIASNPHSFVKAGELTYFVARANGTIDQGEEIWRTDGSAAGTQIVVDLTPLGQSSSPRFLSNVNGSLFFSAQQPGLLAALWKTDGTANGTIRVTSADGTPLYGFSDLVHMGDAYYFAGATQLGNVELWRTDGTATGTWQVRDINPGTANSLDYSPAGTTSLPTAFHVMENEIYFAANDGVAGRELWKSDGTAEGTVRVADIQPGPYGGIPGGGGTPFAHVGGVLYFPAIDETNGIELWRSDGTEAGTFLVKDVAPGNSSSSPQQLTAFGNQLFYVATDEVNGRGLWRTDGTEAGTNLVYSSRSGLAVISDLTVFDERLYFSAPSFREPGQGIWRTNASGSEPEPLTVPNAPTSYPMMVPSPGYQSDAATFNNMTVVGDAMFFSAREGMNGDQTLWRLDGTVTDPAQVYPLLWNQTAPTNPQQITNVDGALFFAAGMNLGTSSALEPWQSDGTKAGTRVIKDLSGRSASSSIGASLEVDGRLFFSNGASLWVTEGSAASTRFVAAHASSAYGAFPVGRANGLYFFHGGDGLWRSDGTSAGTYKIKSIAAGSRAYQLDYAELDGILYFGAGGAGNYELWRSDGTEAGTYVVSDLNSSGGLNSGFPLQITRLGGHVYFSISSGAARGLWRSDGTAAGTNLVKGFAGGGPHYMLQGGDSLYFAASDGFSGHVLWKSDGTTEGTFPLTADEFDAYISSPGSYPNYSQLAYVNDHLFFTSYNSLWKSDGTKEGTAIVKTIKPDGGGAFGPGGHPMLIAAGGDVYFVANDGTHGYELWKSDGSADGTAMVADLSPGSSSGMFSPNGWVNAVGVGEKLYFAQPIAYREPWVTDGTEAGTMVAAEIRPGSMGSDPRSLTNVNGRLYFTANDGTHGTELWMLSPDRAAMAAGDYDQNGVTDGADFLKWQRSFGSGDVTNDGDGDSMVGLGDLDAWKQGYGTPAVVKAVSGGAAVAALMAEEEENVTEPAFGGEPHAAVDGGKHQAARRETAARDALFAAGDLSHFFAVGEDDFAEASWRRRRDIRGR